MFFSMHFHTEHELNHKIKVGVHFQEATSNMFVSQKKIRMKSVIFQLVIKLYVFSNDIFSDILKC